ncbi:MAG: Hsp20/alpha crystallin family protein [Oligoflexales bacterium]|nr:Hsp20/alpha crystallin family protein [Oligoflexales bacterium]
MSFLQPLHRAKNTGSLLNEFFTDIDRVFDNRWLPSVDAKQDKRSVFSPHCDIKENREGYHFSFDLPGVNKSDVDVKLENRTLRVRAEKKSNFDQNKDNSVLSERYYGLYERTFSLPESVDTAKIHAKFDNGVLEVLIPKNIEKTQSQKIEVS